MNRPLVPALFGFMALAVLATPALAQAPAPRVTITGLFDQVTSAGKNFYDANYSRDNDRQWYARTRFRPDFQFQVGRTKAVLGLEIDLMYGQAGPNDGGYPGNVSGTAGGGGSTGTPAQTTHFGTNGSFDPNTDVGGMIEIKWMYTEFDLTGKDSVLPFIPVQTVARAFTWRFAPNTALDLVGVWFSAGDALDTAEVLNGVHARREANDSYLGSMRVRLAF